MTLLLFIVLVVLLEKKFTALCFQLKAVNFLLKSVGADRLSVAPFSILIITNL